jgi:hypothetical protein
MWNKVAKVFRLDSERKVIVLVAFCEGMVLIIALVGILTAWLYLRGPS